MQILPATLHKFKHPAGSDIARLLLLWLIVLAIYYPVFYSQYLYTDEATQIWLTNKGLNLTSIPQGRYLTYLLFKSLFGFIKTTAEFKYARLFSLTGWMLCLPVWYYTLKSLIAKNRLPPSLLLLSLIYMVCMPSFIICISWGACLEMFIACTSGLMAGCLYYSAITIQKNRRYPPSFLLSCSIALGLVSLFTYQNGIGCFFIPFFISFIANKKITREIVAGMGWALFIYALYYLFFKWSLYLTNMLPDERSAMAIDPVKKIIFLFSRPLAASFHFTKLFSDKSLAGEIIYLLIVLFWFVLTLSRLHSRPPKEKIFYFGGIMVLFVLAYLPSMIALENYPSNRTLFALNFIVFILIAESLLSVFKSKNKRNWLTGLTAFLMIANAGYNYRYEFLYPATTEYSLIKKTLLKNYIPSTAGIYVIRPAEKFFVQHYGIVASWDEFGVPSTAKKWTIEPLIKQIIFEKTGNRAIAENLIIKSWENKESFLHSGTIIQNDDIVIDIESMFQ